MPAPLGLRATERAAPRLQEEAAGCAKHSLSLSVEFLHVCYRASGGHRGNHLFCRTAGHRGCRGLVPERPAERPKENGPQDLPGPIPSGLREQPRALLMSRVLNHYRNTQNSHPEGSS